MNPAGKLGAYGLVLAVALGGGALVGNAVGPIDDGAAVDTHDDGTSTHGDDEHGETTGNEADAADATEDLVPAGLQIAEDGYSLDADQTILASPSAGEFRFRILGPGGAVVRDFVKNHERELHLIVVGTDLATYAHLHPERADDGTWSVALGDLAPGVYRAYADFAVADGPELTLGVDLAVPQTARTAHRDHVDRYDVFPGGGRHAIPCCRGAYTPIGYSAR